MCVSEVQIAAVCLVVQPVVRQTQGNDISRIIVVGQGSVVLSVGRTSGHGVSGARGILNYLSGSVWTVELQKQGATKSTNHYFIQPSIHCPCPSVHSVLPKLPVQPGLVDCRRIIPSLTHPPPPSNSKIILTPSYFLPYSVPRPPTKPSIGPSVHFHYSFSTFIDRPLFISILRISSPKSVSASTHCCLLPASTASARQSYFGKATQSAQHHELVPGWHIPLVSCLVVTDPRPARLGPPTPNL